MPARRRDVYNAGKWQGALGFGSAALLRGLKTNDVPFSPLPMVLSLTFGCLRCSQLFETKTSFATQMHSDFTCRLFASHLFMQSGVDQFGNAALQSFAVGLNLLAA